MSTYDQSLEELAAKIKSYGLRVFIAEKGTYGLYTDVEGSRVVGFESRSGNITFSGKLMYSAGWRIEEAPQSKEDFLSALYTPAPCWVSGGLSLTYQTLERQLKDYQQSSKYVEV